jgi:tyrosine-specific transport protein
MCGVIVAALAIICLNTVSITAFSQVSPTIRLNSVARSASGRTEGKLFVSLLTEELADEVSASSKKELSSLLIAGQEELPPYAPSVERNNNFHFNVIMSKVNDKIGGQIDETRISFPEYSSGEVPRMYSSLQYNKNEQGKVTSASHSAGSVFSAAALIAGTTIGAGALALPTATAVTGFLPSSAAMIGACVYMTFSGLAIAELTLNHMGGTGRPGLGLLGLLHSSLGLPLSRVATGGFFFLNYAVLAACIAQGGTNLEGVLNSIPGLESLAAVPGAGQLVLSLLCGLFLYIGNSAAIENVSKALMVGASATFLGAIGMGAHTADWGALVSPMNQHPELVVNCLPIVFVALTYQNVVPSVVTQLEGDRSKITKAIVGGTVTPLLLFMAWNAVVLGNSFGADTSDMAPVAALLQNGAAAGESLLAPLVGAFSSLAVISGIFGLTTALADGWKEVAPKSIEFEKFKPLLYALIFCPPIAVSMSDPDIFYRALDFGGAFGVSTLFLVLPPLMVWRERYVETDNPLATTPLVPFGKLTLGSMWKAAGTLIIEQGAEKLGIVDFVKDHLP